MLRLSFKNTLKFYCKTNIIPSKKIEKVEKRKTSSVVVLQQMHCSRQERRGLRKSRWETAAVMGQMLWAGADHVLACALGSAPSVGERPREKVHSWWLSPPGEETVPWVTGEGYVSGRSSDTGSHSRRFPMPIVMIKLQGLAVQQSRLKWTVPRLISQWMKKNLIPSNIPSLWIL